MGPNHAVWAVLCLTLALVTARPSPEAESDAGYSYKPPYPGLRLNYHHQPSWNSPVASESRARATEVTVEQVPIRLVQSREIAPATHTSAQNRGAYHFPAVSGRLQQEQHDQQYYRNHEQLEQQQRQQQYAASSQQQHRGAYLPSQSQQQAQSYNYQQQPYNNAATQQYRQNETPQQRGAYQFPQQNNVNNHQPQQSYVNNHQPQVERQQGRNIHGGNNPNQAASGSDIGYQYNTNPTPGYQYTNPTPGYQYTNPTPGYQYTNPTTETPQDVDTTTETAPSSTSTELPRITIAISKSTVIHTGKGSYQIDEKTGSPKPIIAEAHSYAGVPEPTKKPEPASGDALNSEGTGNFPIIAKGTPPEEDQVEGREEEEEENTEGNTEEPTTTPANVDDTSSAPVPTAQAPVSLYASTAWPVRQYGHHAHVVVAPGQTQYFAIGTSAPMSQYFTAPQYVTTGLQPAAHYVHPYLQQALPLHQYAHQYGAYHPSVFARLNSNFIQKSALKWPYAGYYPIVIRDPFVGMYGALNQVVEYGAEADVCRGKAVGPSEAPVETADSPVEPRVSDQELEGQQAAATHQLPDTPNRTVIHKGGVAIAGPGGYADAGHGGTAIVGPGGTAYSSPNAVSVVGPGGKVLLQGANSETILAKGPIIYYHKA